MIIEDYVSFETAKLLKGQGFDIPCIEHYYQEGDYHHIQRNITRGKRKDNGQWAYGYVDATMYRNCVVIHTDNATHEVEPDTVGQTVNSAMARRSPSESSGRSSRCFWPFFALLLVAALVVKLFNKKGGEGVDMR